MLMFNLSSVIGTVVNKRWAKGLSFPHRDFFRSECCV